MEIFVRNCVAADGTPIPKGPDDSGYYATAIWNTGRDIVVTVDGVEYRGEAKFVNRGEPIKVLVLVDWIPYVRIVGKF